MNDIRRTILWVIFGFSMVLLWDQWQVFNGKPPTFMPTSNQSAKNAATASSATTNAVTGATSASGVSGVPVPSLAVPVQGAAAGGVPAGAPTLSAQSARERVVLTTDVLNLTFDSEGGTLVRSVFARYTDDSDKNAGFVLMDESTNRVYVAQTGLIGASALPTHKTPTTALPGERSLRDGQNEMTLTFESAEVGGVKLRKTYGFKRGSYEIAVRHEVINTGASAVTPQLYLQLVRDGNKPPGESSFYSTFTGPAIYTEAQKYQKVEFKDIENNKVDVEKQATNGYVAMVQHYFASAWLLGDGLKRDLFFRKVDLNLYAVGMITPIEPVAAGSSRSIESKLFVGPQEEKTLEAIAPGLERR